MKEWEGEYKHIQFRLPTPLYEDFYRAFPGRGERSFLLKRFVTLLMEELEGRREGREMDAFIEKLLEEVEMNE